MVKTKQNKTKPLLMGTTVPLNSYPLLKILRDIINKETGT